MSSLVSVRDFAGCGDVAWKDGAEVDRESGMEGDSTGNFRVFCRVKVRTGDEHGEPVNRDGRSNAHRQSIEKVRSPANGFRPGMWRGRLLSLFESMQDLRKGGNHVGVP